MASHHATEYSGCRICGEVSPALTSLCPSCGCFKHGDPLVSNFQRPGLQGTPWRGGGQHQLGAGQGNGNKGGGGKGGGKGSKSGGKRFRGMRVGTWGSGAGPPNFVHSNRFQALAEPGPTFPPPHHRLSTSPMAPGPLFLTPPAPRPTPHLAPHLRPGGPRRRSQELRGRQGFPPSLIPRCRPPHHPLRHPLGEPKPPDQFTQGKSAQRPDPSPPHPGHQPITAVTTSTYNTGKTTGIGKCHRVTTVTGTTSPRRRSLDAILVSRIQGAVMPLREVLAKA
jgi:hypothetical protein